MNLIKYAFNWKYRFFRRKLRAVREAIAEVEFKISKARDIREGVRADRDRASENVQRFSSAILSETDKEKVKVLTENRDKAQKDVERYEAQMKMIDDQINGVKGSDAEGGMTGHLDLLASYAELSEMYKKHIEQI